MSPKNFQGRQRISRNFVSRRSLISKPIDRQSRGQQAEALAQQYLHSQGFFNFRVRQSIIGVEVDLMAVDPSGSWHLFEVKTAPFDKPLEMVIKSRQILRYKLVLAYLIEKNARKSSPGCQPTRAHLMLISGEQIRLVYDFFIHN